MHQRLSEVANLVPHESATNIAPPPSRPVIDEMAMLGDNLNNLHTLIDGLENRLEPVLSPPHPQPSQKENCSESGCQVIASIKSNQAQVTGACVKINDILSRLQL